MRPRLSSYMLGFAALAVAQWSASHALALQVATTFDTADSSVMLTQTADLNNPSTASSNQFQVPIAGTSEPIVSSGFQINHTITATTQTGSSSTVAKVGTYQVTNATNLALNLVAGSGITQTNVPGHAFTGPSESDINVNAVWDLGTTGFPSARGHFPGVSYDYPVAGIVGIGGKDELKIDLLFYDLSISQNPIGSIITDNVFPNLTGSSVAFATSIAGATLINGGAPLPGGTELTMTGTIDFMATNDDSPSSLTLSADSSVGTIDATAMTVIPEPASAALAVLSAGLLARRRRR